MSTLNPAKLNILPLEEVLEYENEHIVHKFMEKFDISFEESEDIFNETKKWLWICAITNSNQKEDSTLKLSIDDSMLVIDEMWHTFILFTHLYKEFCNKYFGCFIHHLPTTKAEKDKFKQRIKDDKRTLFKENYDKTKKQYSFIYDHLGVETLKKWYDEYPEKYSKERLSQLRTKDSI